MAGDIEFINSLTAEQARSILIYLSHDRSVAGKVRKFAKDMTPHTSLRAVCVQCDLAFDPSITSKNCIYHNGELEVDDDGDFWADHDENCHGTIDTDEMREEFPEGFVWTCCNQSGDTSGCRWGRHQADPSKVEEGLDVKELDDDTDDDDDDDEEEFTEDEEESDEKDRKNKRGNGDESQNSGPNKRQKP